MTRLMPVAFGAVLLGLNLLSPQPGLRAQQPDQEKEPAKQKEVEDKARAAAARAQNSNNLKRIGIAFHEFLDEKKTFPRHAIYSPDGKTPLLSWRVAILPYLGEKALYDQFKFDEPWDSQHNRRLIPKMPKVYAPVLAGKADEGKTFYQVFTGPNTMF